MSSVITKTKPNLTLVAHIQQKVKRLLLYNKGGFLLDEETNKKYNYL